MYLKVKRLSEHAVFPKYAHEGDAGLDLYSIEEMILQPGRSGLVKTGIAIELPENTEAQIRPRSGLALKHNVTVLNSPGTVDEGYRGEICVLLINHSNHYYQIQKGEKIAQMVIKPTIKLDVIEVTSLSVSARGQGGYGSTG